MAEKAKTPKEDVEIKPDAITGTVHKKGRKRKASKANMSGEFGEVIIEQKDAEPSAPAPEAKSASSKKDFKRRTPIVHSEVVVSENNPDFADSVNSYINNTSNVNAMTHKEFQRNAQQAKRERDADFAASGETAVNTVSIRQAVKETLIVRDDIVGIDRTPFSATGEFSNRVCAVVHHDGFRVLIPYEDMFLDPPLVRSSNETREEYHTRQELILTNMLGASIRYQIMSIVNDPTTKKPTYCIGSRVAAMLRDQARMYRKQSDSGKARVNVGDVVDADIVAVGKNGIRANVRGVDTQIPLHLLTCRYVEVCKDYFTTGDRIPVKIHEIQDRRTDGGRGYFVLANAKEIERQTLVQKHIQKLNVGSTYVATVVIVKDTEYGPVISLFIDNDYVQIPVTVKNIRTSSLALRFMQPGWVVAVTITNINTARGVVYGDIKKVVSERSIRRK